MKPYEEHPDEFSDPREKNERDNENQEFGTHKDVKGDENSEHKPKYHPQCVIPVGEENPTFEENPNKVHRSKTIEGSHAAISEYKAKAHPNPDEDQL